VIAPRRLEESFFGRAVLGERTLSGSANGRSRISDDQATASSLLADADNRHVYDAKDRSHGALHGMRRQSVQQPAAGQRACAPPSRRRDRSPTCSRSSTHSTPLYRVFRYPRPLGSRRDSGCCGRASFLELAHDSALDITSVRWVSVRPPKFSALVAGRVPRAAFFRVLPVNISPLLVAYANAWDRIISDASAGPHRPVTSPSKSPAYACRTRIGRTAAHDQATIPSSVSSRRAHRPRQLRQRGQFASPRGTSIHSPS